MTGTKQTKRAGFKAIFSLITALLLCFVMAFGLACNSEEATEDKTTYTKSETDEQTIANGNFEFKTADSKPTSFPIYTSISWTKATDNASSSAVNSGIVDTDDFDTWFDNLYADTDFVKYLKRNHADVVEALGENPSDDDVKSALKTAFGNPGVNATHGEDGETKILMINNYVDSVPGYGTAQKFTSTTSITLDKNAYGKISVWVKTKNVNTNLADSDEYGANIRIVNTLAGVTQAEYQIKGIRNEEWTQYSVYVKGNDFATATLKVVLGLGFGSGTSNVENNVEGTAYFDDVVYEEITEETYIAATKDEIVSEINPESQSSSDTLAVFAGDKTTFGYDMNTALFFQNANVTANGSYVVSPQGISGGRYDTNNKSKVTVGTVQSLVENYDDLSFMDASAKAVRIYAEYASYEVSLGKISVAPNSYHVISFYLKTELAFDTTGLSFYVIDEDGNTGSNNVTNTVLSSVVTEKVDESLTPDDDNYDAFRGWKRYTVVLKNNFVEGDRTCELILNLGPTDANETDKNLFALGTVTLANFLEATGTIPSVDEKDYKDYTVQDHLYSMISGATDSSTVFSYALYAGYTEDYSDSEDEPSYKMTIAPSNEGVETTRPAAPDGFIGVTGGSVYVNTDENASASSVNKNANAGIINTKYLDNYTDFVGIKDFFDTDDKLQPLMIYNQTAGSYGYLSDNSTLSKDSFTVITVRVKVTGDATAYVYVVDTAIDSENRTKVLTQYDNEDRALAVAVKANMMDSDGWATVNIYLSAGKDAIQYRVELWNGSRDNMVESKGYVFFDDYAISSGSESAFTSALDTANNEGYIEDANFKKYTTVLTDEEKEYNEKYLKDHDEAYFTPRTDVVWAQTTDVVDGQIYLFARNDTLNRSASTIPSDSDSSDEETGSGCQDVDQSTLWISLSSLILAVALVVAIIALIVKRVRIKRQKNQNDAKAHYNVKSRNKTQETISQKKSAKVVKEVPEETTTEEPEAEAEEYQYGEVLEDFDDSVSETPAAESESEEAPVTESATEETPATESESDKTE